MTTGHSVHVACHEVMEQFWHLAKCQAAAPATCTSWSGIRESNPHLELGKLAYYHCTNPAKKSSEPLGLVGPNGAGLIVRERGTGGNRRFPSDGGADDGGRTRDLRLGKATL